MANPPTAGGSREHCPPLKVEIDRNLVVHLRREAAQRDMPVARLVGDLLDRIVTDGLTGAVLDDGDLPGA
jgi:hypothetical protein